MNKRLKILITIGSCIAILTTGIYIGKNSTKAISKDDVANSAELQNKKISEKEEIQKKEEITEKEAVKEEQIEKPEVVEKAQEEKIDVAPKEDNTQPKENEQGIILLDYTGYYPNDLPLGDISIEVVGNVLTPAYEARGIIAEQVTPPGTFIAKGAIVKVKMYSFDQHYEPINDYEHNCEVEGCYNK